MKWPAWSVIMSCIVSFRHSMSLVTDLVMPTLTRPVQIPVMMTTRFFASVKPE
jgi:hypothetical protein